MNTAENIAAQNKSISRARNRSRKNAVRQQFPGKVIPLSSRSRLVVGDLVEICGAALPENLGKVCVVVGINERFAEIESVRYLLDVQDERTGVVEPKSVMRAFIEKNNLYRLDNSLKPQAVSGFGKGLRV